MPSSADASRDEQQEAVRALTPCDLFVLDQPEFNAVLKSSPEFAASLQEALRSRYQAVQAGR